MDPSEMRTHLLGLQPTEDVILQVLMSETSGIGQSPLLRPSQYDIGHDRHARGPSQYEFGWESSVMVPHAYASVRDGSINVTRSCGDLSALYWFSPKHENLPC